MIPIKVSRLRLITNTNGFSSIKWLTTMLKYTTHAKYEAFPLFIRTVVYITGIMKADKII